MSTSIALSFVSKYKLKKIQNIEIKNVLSTGNGVEVAGVGGCP